MIAKYNPVYVRGKIKDKGYRESVNRKNEIFKFLESYNRTFSVFDLGAAEGYFTFQIADNFNSFVVSSECDKNRKLLEYFEQNEFSNTVLLDKKLKLEDLRKLSEVQYFDVFLALNVVHHFDEPFQKVLDVIMSMCSFCFFEHPSEYEGKTTKNHTRLKNEKLKLERYSPKTLCETKSFGKNIRKLQLLKNNQNIKITRPHLIANKYKNQGGIDIFSTFDNIKVDYSFRDEKRDFYPGIDLRTFYELGGNYPSNQQLKINILNLSEKYVDLGPGNVLITNNGLKVIDQKDKKDSVNSPEKLIKYLRL